MLAAGVVRLGCGCGIQVDMGERWEVYHEQGPEGVVEEDDRGSQKHGDAYKLVKLCGGEERGSVVS